MWHAIDTQLLLPDCFMDMFFDLATLLDEEQLLKLVMTLWSVWTKRNIIVWEDRIETTSEVIFRGHHTLVMWRMPRDSVHTHLHEPRGPPARVRWTPPAGGHVKCNVDTALHQPTRTTGYGICIRGGGGQFILAQMVHSQPILAPKEGEAYALMLAITWLTNLGYEEAILEFDCKLLVDHLHSSIEDHTEFGDLVMQCKYLLSFKPLFKVHFIKRQANEVAHKLARMAATTACTRVFSLVPDCIASLIINEMS